MPGKKKKGSKKKKTKSASSASRKGEDKVEGLEHVDPGTLIDGTIVPATDGKGKKKKKGLRRKKVSRSEKAIEKLEKATEKIKADKNFYKKFVDRLDKWLNVNASRMVALFRKFDDEGDGVLSYDEFKSGMFDLNAPCTNLELHLLAKLLDKENSGEIDYTEFRKGLQYIRELEELEKEAEETEDRLILSERQLNHCKCCQMGIAEPYQVQNPKYLYLEFRLVTFDGYRDHPGHFGALVHSHQPVHALIQLIVEQTGIQSTKLSLFLDKSRSQDAMLPPELTLEELGHEGDTIDDPEELSLFYDYKVEFTDCPLLMCDYYFSNQTKAKAL